MPGFVGCPIPWPLRRRDSGLAPIGLNQWKGDAERHGESVQTTPAQGACQLVGRDSSTRGILPGSHAGTHSTAASRLGTNSVRALPSSPDLAAIFVSSSLSGFQQDA